jgi:hypothetical protein
MKTIGNGLQNQIPGEKASFLSENILPMQESGYIYKRPKGDFWNNQNRFGIFADGHTEKQMIPHIQYKDKTIVFCADLLLAGHIPVAYVMGYDTRTLLTMPEKKNFERCRR